MFYVRRVQGESMLPNLKPGQIVLLIRGRPRVGDVVMLRHGGLEKIKRLASAQNGQVRVLGDNLAASTDSRRFGWLDKTAIVGRLIWPRV